VGKAPPGVTPQYTPTVRDMDSATCSICGNRFAFDPDRGDGRLDVGRGDARVVLCFPACPRCGKRNTSQVAPATDER
jgi:hypothetical protein